MASRSYPMIPVYFKEDTEASLIQDIETLAASKGLSNSTVFKRCVEACLPLLRDKKNVGKTVVSGTVTLDLTPPRRGPRGRAYVQKA